MCQYSSKVYGRKISYHGLEILRTRVMVRHFLFGPTKRHKLNCTQEFLIRKRIAVSLLFIFFSFFFVYIYERYIAQIPIWVAVLLIALLAWYVIVSFFELVVLYHGDKC